MHYSPHLHHRKSIRLKGYDYSGNGLYFVTICTKDKKHLFGKIENAGMVLNVFGQTAHNHWGKLHERFSNVELDVFQIMPNHMHGIILLNAPPVRAGFTPAPDNETPALDNGEPALDNETAINNGEPGINTAHTAIDTGGKFAAGGGGDRAGVNPAPTIGQIVAAYKSLVANECLQIFKQNYCEQIMGKIWHRNYYEHIIRTDAAYSNIRNYILCNPSNWKQDCFNK